MNRPFWQSRLIRELLFAMLMAFVVASGLFMGLQTISNNLTDHYFGRSQFVEQENEKIITSFRQYILKNEVCLTDVSKLNAWAKNEKYVEIYIYADGKLVYASSPEYMAEDALDIALPALVSKKFYNVTFRDQEAKLYIEPFYYYQYDTLLTFLSLAVAFLCFVLMMLFFIHKKIAYIGQLESEIKILEGGELDYEIAIKGKDELSRLAESINDMRLAFRHRLDSENQAQAASRELITAVSHDLRTPLTALIGYLDIIVYKKYDTDQKMMKYLNTSRDKAYQIKLLSDKLFDYFTFFAHSEEEPEFQNYEGRELMTQLIDEHVVWLQNSGFSVESCYKLEPFNMSVNLMGIRRVLDNLFSNIVKYADPSVAVAVECVLQGSFLSLCFENTINLHSDVKNSTGIGLKICKRIVDQHQGSLTLLRNEETYLVKILLPITSGVGYSR